MPSGHPLTKKQKKGILKLIKKNPDLTSKEIAKKFKLSKSTITRLLKKKRIFFYGSLSKIEKKAYKWFLSQGIKKREITKILDKHKRNPDFLVKGKPYEIKSYANNVFMTPKQFEQIKNLYPNTTILIFDDENDYPIFVLKFKEMQKFAENKKGKIFWLVSKSQNFS